MKRESMPQIDVIITVYKPDEKLRQLLCGLHHQTLLPSRIILINTEVQYWKEEWIEGIPEAEVHHIKAAEFDHGGTRRMAAELSNSEYMVVMTQDAVPADEKLLEKLYQAMQDEDVAVAYARQLANPDCNPIDAYTRSFNYPQDSRKKTKADMESMGIKTFFCSDVCAIYRKKDYLQLGGFVEKTIFNEDAIFARKVLEAGKSVYYAAAARVYHSHNYTNMQQFRRNFDLAVSQTQNPQTFAGIPSESEGIRMVRATADHLLRNGKWYLLPKLVLNSAAKYAGYLLGRRYNRLPRGLVLFCTSNRNYWK
ncbi:MAG: glycosyltransferase family 2 protein [Lachnospiraceae bacterium]|nr:glycosyltransferase family 2 protein [Lachnospiraceae bacterium]